MKLIENNKVGLFDNVVIDTESIKYQSIQQKKAKKEGEKIPGIISSVDFDGFVNSDIVVETEDGLYLVESLGFMKVDSLNYAMHRIAIRFPFISYHDIRNKEDFNEDLLRDIRNEIEEELKLK